MKRFFVLTTTVGAAAWLMVGCEQAEQTPPKRVVHHKPVKPKAVVAEEPKPVKPPKLILPGTADYLDLKNGFRDVILGAAETSFTDLILKERDDVAQTTTYTRSGDLLNLENVPLQAIEYTFYKNQLSKIAVKWKVEFPNEQFTIPPSTGLAANCTELYGRPKQQHVQPDASQYAWAGQKVRIFLDEIKLPGVANKIGGGWAIPPVYSGEMVVESIPLRREMDFSNSSQSAQNKVGL